MHFLPIKTELNFKCFQIRISMHDQTELNYKKRKKNKDEQFLILMHVLTFSQAMLSHQIQMHFLTVQTGQVKPDRNTWKFRFSCTFSQSKKKLTTIRILPHSSSHKLSPQTKALKLERRWLIIIISSFSCSQACT